METFQNFDTSDEVELEFEGLHDFDFDNFLHLSSSQRRQPTNCNRIVDSAFQQQPAANSILSLNNTFTQSMTTNSFSLSSNMIPTPESTIMSPYNNMISMEDAFQDDEVVYY